MTLCTPYAYASTRLIFCWIIFMGPHGIKYSTSTRGNGQFDLSKESSDKVTNTFFSLKFRISAIYIVLCCYSWLNSKYPFMHE